MPPANRPAPADRVPDRDLAAWRAQWADRSKRDAAKASAVSLIARHPKEFEAFAGLDHPALVALADAARAADDADALTLIDVYLVGALPPQRIVGAFRDERGSK